MKKNFYQFNTVKKSLRICLFFAVFFIAIYDLLLINIPEFSPFGYEVGTIFRSLSLSYISAFIFFYLNIHLSQYKGRTRGKRYVNNKIVDILHMNKALQSVLIKYGELDNGQDLGMLTLNEELINKACEKISSFSPVEVQTLTNLYFQNWFSYFDYQHTQVRSVLESLSFQNLYIDDELIEIMVNLEDHFDNHLNIFKGKHQGVHFEKDDLTFFSSGIIGFNKYTQYLYEYKKKLDKYI